MIKLNSIVESLNKLYEEKDEFKNFVLNESLKCSEGCNTNKECGKEDAKLYDSNIKEAWEEEFDDEYDYIQSQDISEKEKQAEVDKLINKYNKVNEELLYYFKSAPDGQSTFPLEKFNGSYPEDGKYYTKQEWNALPCVDGGQFGFYDWDNLLIEDPDGFTESKSVNEACGKKLTEEFSDFEIPGFDATLNDEFEDDGYKGYSISYSKDGIDLVTVEVWDGEDYINVTDSLYSPSMFGGGYDTLDSFVADLNYKFDRYINESCKKSSLTEARNSSYENVWEPVYDFILDTLYNLESNELECQIVARKVNGYKPEWCDDDGQSDTSRKLEKARNQYVEALTNSYFEHAEDAEEDSEDEDVFKDVFKGNPNVAMYFDDDEVMYKDASGREISIGYIDDGEIYVNSGIDLSDSDKELLSLVAYEHNLDYIK